MKRSIRRENPVVSMVNKMLIDLAAPSNISYFWNYGILLGVCLGVQIISGVLLAMHYCADVSLAFSSVEHITRDVKSGYVLRSVHGNGASMFFVCVFLHIGRGVYYGGYNKRVVWNVGVALLLLMIVTAFLGYVLPWGQMSYWAATVITNMLSAIPYVGEEVVRWIWGGFSVSNVTLNRFYSLHYLLPFVLGVVGVIHVVVLHEGGSNNVVGVRSEIDKVWFHSSYSLKDLYGGALWGGVLLMIVYWYPYELGDSENYKRANELVTPEHIKPEWYFLFAYAILRSIPNKLGGVIGLVLSILVLLVIPYTDRSNYRGLRFRVGSKVLYWLLVGDFIVLTWIGGQVVEDPYIWIGEAASVVYFSYFMVLLPGVSIVENRIAECVWHWTPPNTHEDTERHRRTMRLLNVPE